MKAVGGRKESPLDSGKSYPLIVTTPKRRLQAKIVQSREQVPNVAKGSGKNEKAL
jgi:hypothetical protein